MRGNVLRSLVAVALVFSAAAAAAGDSGGPEIQGEAKPQVVDAPGDANGVNGQGLADDAPSAPQTMPASVDSHDILDATVTAYGKYKSVKGRKGRTFVPEGLLVTLEVAERPSNGAYRVRGVTSLCDMVAFQYFVDVTSKSGYLRHTCTDTGEPPAEFFDIPVQASESGNTVTWRVPLAQLPKQLQVGSVLTGLAAETLSDGGVVTFPVVDDVWTSATYRIGDA